MSGTLRLRWVITPNEAPQPLRPCRRCHGAKFFQSSGKFRINANGKKLDAWLIYHCQSCGSPWNRPIIERRPRQEIDGALLQALHANDPALAAKVAFDVDQLRRSTDQIREFPEVGLRQEVLSQGAPPYSALEILLAVPVPTALRTDRLLAGQLGLSRNRLQKLEKAGRLCLSGGALKRPVRDQQRVRVDLGDATGGVDLDLAQALARRIRQIGEPSPAAVSSNSR